MSKVDLDVNFPILIIVLSVFLIALLEGGIINEFVYHKSGDIGRVYFSAVFLFGGMFIIFGILTAPSEFKQVSYITVTIGLAVLLANTLSYFKEGVLSAPAFSEIITGFLIVTGGLLLYYTNKENI